MENQKKEKAGCSKRKKIIKRVSIIRETQRLGFESLEQDHIKESNHKCCNSDISCFILGDHGIKKVGISPPFMMLPL